MPSPGVFIEKVTDKPTKIVNVNKFTITSRKQFVGDKLGLFYYNPYLIQEDVKILKPVIKKILDFDERGGWVPSGLNNHFSDISNRITDRIGRSSQVQASEAYEIGLNSIVFKAGKLCLWGIRVKIDDKFKQLFNWDRTFANYKEICILYNLYNLVLEFLKNKEWEITNPTWEITNPIIEHELTYRIDAFLNHLLMCRRLYHMNEHPHFLPNFKLWMNPTVEAQTQHLFDFSKNYEQEYKLLVKKVKFLRAYFIDES